MTYSTDILQFIRFWLAWIILSNPCFAKEGKQASENLKNLKAITVSKETNIYAEPDLKSTPLAKLSQGTVIEVLEFETGKKFYKARTQIDEGFPIDGWVLAEAITFEKEAGRFQPKTQPYRPSPLSEEKPPPKEAFSTSLPEKIDPSILKLPKSANSKKNAEENEEPELLFPLSRKKRISNPWRQKLTFLFGTQNWNENLNSQNNQNTAFNFLNFDISGPTFQLEAQVGFHEEPFQWGGYGHYNYTFFKDTVSATNLNIQKSDILAQFHELELGPYAEWNYPFRKKWKFSPEGRIMVGLQRFITNQLSDKPATNKLSQPVLFNFSALYVKVNFLPTVSGPYDLTFEPIIGVTFPYFFSEDPIQTQDTQGNALAATDQIRTGDPDGAPILLDFGASFFWNLKTFRFPKSSLGLQLLREDLSKNYKGPGNRASVATQDVQSEVAVTTYSIAFGYEF